MDLTFVLSGDDEAFVSVDGQSLALYTWNRRHNNPHFRDIRPLGHRGVLTNDAPFDHPWHHGLWWSFKFINDVNFWEDDARYGGTRTGLGRAVVRATALGDSARSLTHLIDWSPDDAETPFLVEERTLSLVSDDHGPDWAIDWKLSFTASTDVTLATTPYPEFPWGGYAGLNYRPARALASGEVIVSSDRSTGASQVHAKAAKWRAYSGFVDGAGTGTPDDPAIGGIAIMSLDAGESTYATSAAGGFGFISTAPLMSGELRLSKGESLSIHQSTVILGTRPDPAQLDSYHSAFAARSNPQTFP